MTPRDLDVALLARPRHEVAVQVGCRPEADGVDDCDGAAAHVPHVHHARVVARLDGWPLRTCAARQFNTGTTTSTATTIRPLLLLTRRPLAHDGLLLLRVLLVIVLLLLLTRRPLAQNVHLDVLQLTDEIHHVEQAPGAAAVVICKLYE